MIGQYPGKTPEKYSASKRESKNHIDKMVQDANIRVFCCLQDEIPPQDDFATWNFFNGNYKDFSHYGTIAKNALSSSSEEITFLHTGITDLSTPDSSSLSLLLCQILDEVLNERNVYIHCWGGRGRAGTIGAILLGLLYPEIESMDCLNWVQRAYDTREGANTMPVVLQKSPQTSDQRDFVHKFISEIRHE